MCYPGTVETNTKAPSSRTEGDILSRFRGHIFQFKTTAHRLVRVCVLVGTMKYDIGNQTWENPKCLLAIYSPSPFTICRLLVHGREQVNSPEGRNWLFAYTKSLQKWPNIVHAEPKLFSMWTDTQVRTIFRDTMTENSNPVFPSIFSISILQAQTPLKQVVWF